MNTKALSTFTGTSEAFVKRMLSMDAPSIMKDAEYVTLLKDIDRDLLEKTLPSAREAYELGLPAFERTLSERYGIENTPMSAYTLGNWVVGALQYPENTEELLNMHARVPGNVVSEGLGDLLHMLDRLPQGASEWQRALAALSLPLMKG